jgi:hypothetical protein
LRRPPSVSDGINAAAEEGNSRNAELRDRWIWRRLHTEADTTNWPRGEIDISAVDFATELGTWALNLRNAGLLMDRAVLRQTQHPADPERQIDEAGTATEWSWWVVAHQDLVAAAGLMRRARRCSDPIKEPDK